MNNLQCPECKVELDLVGKHFTNDLLDDTCITEIDCPKCGSSLRIETKATYEYTFAYDDEENKWPT